MIFSLKQKIFRENCLLIIKNIPFCPTMWTVLYHLFKKLFFKPKIINTIGLQKNMSLKSRFCFFRFHFKEIKEFVDLYQINIHTSEKISLASNLLLNILYSDSLELLSYRTVSYFIVLNSIFLLKILQKYSMYFTTVLL